jgi:ATP-dependent DNA helicase RecG
VLTDGELEDLFRSDEAERVERKQNASDATKIREAICAFANDLSNSQRPGVIFVGQNDDRSCANISISAQLLERLGGLRSDGEIQPFPIMSVTAKTIDGCKVAVAENGNPELSFNVLPEHVLVTLRSRQ